MEFSTIMPLDDVAACDLKEQDGYCLLASRKLARRTSLSILTDAEAERLQLFRLEADRERFLVAHGLKRTVLSSILKCPPQEVPIAFGLGNKPFIPGAQCHFNLSHSGNWVAMMISFKAQVGIDVEQPKPSEDPPLALVCHPDDHFQPVLKTVEQRFYACWTLKEAMSKWDGRGLDSPFNEIRLESVSGNIYRGHHEETIWHARHTVLHDGAHLAYASNEFLKPSHILIV
jgi:4'-phosphopantetheinyl transferase